MVILLSSSYAFVPWQSLAMLPRNARGYGIRLSVAGTTFRTSRDLYKRETDLFGPASVSLFPDSTTTVRQASSLSLLSKALTILVTSG